jgi:hypothetical protein
MQSSQFRDRLLSHYPPFDHIPMHHRHLPAGCSSAYSFQTAMATMDSPQRPQRSSIRYQLQLPVSLKLAHKELYAQSESIGLAGILLSSAFLIPEGSAVELSVTRNIKGAHFAVGCDCWITTYRKGAPL